MQTQPTPNTSPPHEAELTPEHRQRLEAREDLADARNRKAGREVDPFPFTSVADADERYLAQAGEAELATGEILTCPTCHGNGRIEMLEHCPTCKVAREAAKQIKALAPFDTREAARQFLEGESDPTKYCVTVEQIEPIVVHAIATVLHFNKLSAAEHERLALLAEECAEVIQVIGKILRHGYDSYHPLDPDGPSNRDNLESELGDVRHATERLCAAIDLSNDRINAAKRKKAKSVLKYLHHQ